MGNRFNGHWRVAPVEMDAVNKNTPEDQAHS
jgi:hypothetical protein